MQESAKSASGDVSNNWLSSPGGAVVSLVEGLEPKPRACDPARSTTDWMLNQQDLRVVCRGVLAESMAITGSEAGVVYLLDERRAEFERFESLGVGMATRDVLPVKTCEGGMPGSFSSAARTLPR